MIMIQKSQRAVAFALALFCVVIFAAQTLAAGPVSVADIAKKLLPAVVNISTSQYVGRGGEPFPVAPEGSPLNDLLEDVNPNAGQGEDALRQARSLGSGFFISADGYVVTNNHVIEGADEILIYTADNERYVAQLVGTDEKTDLAVLKVTTDKPLPFVEFGDSDTAEIGDWVMAIGNPFGLGGSVSMGIVSARNRNINSGPYDDFIQTDAAINQGSSGGPVFDMDGKVVGVATALIAQGGNSLGIGFAVPTNLAKNIVDQLTEFGETRRGWLGVGIQEVTQDVALAMNRDRPYGALVVEITPSGPADGILQEGDIIIAFNEIEIIDVNDLPLNVSQAPVGDVVNVQVWRAGTMVTNELVLGQLEIGERLVAEARVANASSTSMPLNFVDDGMRLDADALRVVGFGGVPITNDLRKALSIQDHISGLLLEDVSPRSDAAFKGAREGLVISKFDGQDLTSVSQLQILADQAVAAGRQAVLIKVYDPIGIGRYLAIRLRLN